MTNLLNRFAALALVVLTALTIGIPAPASAQPGRHSLTLDNTSGFDIEQIYIRPATYIWAPDWGPNLLVSVLRDQGTVTFKHIQPGSYDIRLVDENGGTCILLDQYFGSDLSWELSAPRLAYCEASTLLLLLSDSN